MNITYKYVPRASLTPMVKWIFIFILVIATTMYAKSQHAENYQVRFSNVENEMIRSCFLKVVERYKELQEIPITLKQKRIKSSTMQAQPVFTWESILGNVSKYRIKLGKFVQDSKKIKVKDIPEDVLTGWFAHELGHVVDYLPYNSWQMMGYGLKYLISGKFRKKAEHAADYIAISYGFHEEIIATKQFLLEQDFVTGKYHEKLNKYYLSIEDVRLCTENEMLLKPTTGEL